MGTTLSSLHVLNGDLEQIKKLLPNEAVGGWSERFVSVFLNEPEDFGTNRARCLSKLVSQPVLNAWIFDSDAVGFAVYQGGKRVAEHIHNPGTGSKLGNIPKFCTLLELPPEDARRLRAIWSKADPETQLELTGALLGAPLYFDAEVLPEETARRDAERVDQWIGQIPKPVKIKNSTTAELIQQIEHFRQTINGYDMVRSPMYYMSEEPWNIEYYHQKTVWWKAQSDGTLAVVGEVREQLDYREEHGRLIGIESGEGVGYDSAGKLPRGFTMVPWVDILEDKRLLMRHGANSNLLTCCDGEGYRLWTNYQGMDYLGCGGGAVMLSRRDDAFRDNISIVKTVDAQSGKTLGMMKLEAPVYCLGYRDGAWWVEHSVDKEDGIFHARLLKLDDQLRILGELELDDNIQQIEFSPDGAYAYLFFYQSRVRAVETNTLGLLHEIRDRSLRIPCGTDGAERVWMRCGTATLEAWSKDLGQPLSRHRLKGTIVGCHYDGAGNLCAAAWDKKNAILRVYRMA